MELEFIQQLAQPADTKIILLVMDGLGGLPRDEDGLTELEAAQTPHLDELAAQSICGLQLPVAPGITPGSGPGHLGLFGYDPLKYQIGRGVLSALGINFDLTSQDVAARGNFCTVDDNGVVTDRRAGRIKTETCAELCDLLNQEIDLPGVELFIKPVKEYRFLLVLRGDELVGEIDDTDPQEVGEKPLPPRPLSQEADKTASLVEQFVNQARQVLADQSPANMLLLRGFAKRPDWPSFEESYQLKAASIAAYPMYRGVSRLVGMHLLDTADDVIQEFDLVKQNWDEFDFFYVHIKRIDSAGEDGDFAKKVSLIEEVDAQLPRLLDCQPAVIIVTGDHSTPSRLHYHGWQPVPVLLHSEACRPDKVTQFGESACLAGGLGPRLPAIDLMPLALANAHRLEKFGA